MAYLGFTGKLKTNKIIFMYWRFFSIIVNICNNEKDLMRK